MVNLCSNQLEFQALVLQVSHPRSSPFIIATAYRSPSYPVALFLPYLETVLNAVSDFNKVCFWGGDWNMDLFQYNSKSDVKSFLDCFNSYGFFPTITVPTRTSNVSPYTQTLIDNIFCNALECVANSGVTCAGIADHEVIICTSSLLGATPVHSIGSRREPLKPRFNYDRTEELKVNISQRLTGFCEIEDPNHGSHLLMTIIQEEVNKLSTIPQTRRYSPIQPWITPGVLRSINKRNCLLKHFMKNRSPENERKYRSYRNALRLTIRHAKRMYYRQQFEKNASNPKRLWSDLYEAIQKNRKHNKPPSRFDMDGITMTDPKDITESFNKYYSQVAQKLDDSLGPSNVDPLSYMSSMIAPDAMTFDTVTEQYVGTLVSTFNDVGAGYDGINVKMFKRVLPCMIKEITHLINICLTKSIFPDNLKVGLITPIHKTGAQSLFSNYRPITVLPVLSKVLEAVMYNQLLDHFTGHNIIFYYQFGFRNHHSAFMPLSLLHDNITACLVDRQVAAGIYLDLARAFDTVNTTILLQKLLKYGISGNSLSLLTSYLTGRSHRLKFDDVISGAKGVTCGVPQGSVLGPLLFLVYINDLHLTCPEAQFFLFADDTAIFYSAPSLMELQRKITSSFSKITTWMHANRLTLSAPKSYYQLYACGGRDSNNNLDILVGNTKLCRAQTVKYLGVLVDENMKFKSHIDKVSAITSRNLGIINRAKHLLNKKLRLTLYNALVLPYFTYCLPIWGANYESTLRPIVTIQKRAVRMIAGLGPMTHCSPLFKELKILKLCDLLKYHTLLIMHDVLFGIAPRVIINKFNMHASVRDTRTPQHFSLVLQSSSGIPTPNHRRLNYRSFCLFSSGPAIWNDVIARNIPNLDDIPPNKTFFKKCLKKLLAESY